LEETPLAAVQEKPAASERLIVFINASELSQRPTRVRTWSPKGESPTLLFCFNSGQDHISAIAGLHRSGFCFRLHEGSVDQTRVIDFRVPEGPSGAPSPPAPHRLGRRQAASQPRSAVRDHVDSTEGHS
jgi:hypothetical protein